MNRLHIEKNRLDLDYHRQLQVLNGIIIFGTTGLFSFIGTFVWKPEFIIRGMLISSFIVLVCLATYFNVDRQMRKISEKLKKLR